MLLLLFNAAPAVSAPSRQRLGLTVAPVRRAPAGPAVVRSRVAVFVAAAITRQIRRPATQPAARAKSANRAGLSNTRKPTP